MKKRLLTYALMVFGQGLFLSLLEGQGMAWPLPPERVAVCTDRTMYAAGEKVRFSAMVFSGGEGFRDNLSRVLYCELITPGGNRIIGGKYLLEGSAALGCLAIPEETLTGIYYLKCYTRFMRNQPASGYACVMLRIINPYRPEVMEGDLPPDPGDTAGNTGDLNPLPAPPEIRIIKERYGPGEEIRITVRKRSLAGTNSQLVLSVVPEGTANYLPAGRQGLPDSLRNGFYLPEIRGISLSGTAVARGTGDPLPGAKVNLSVIGDKDIQALYTDSAGRFWFAMPDLYGKHDLFLCTGNETGFTPELLIDNDFCSRPLSLPSPGFVLSGEERQAALKLAVNARISTAFGTDSTSREPAELNFDQPFYGRPSDVLVIDRYIELPTLEDYINELPVIVRVKKVKDRKQIRFFNSLDEMLNYEPLILVDWVAVNDVETILSIPPAEIDRIELVNAIYVKGRIMYGGIISIVSKRNDFAGIDLPASGLFLNYGFLDPCLDEVSPGPFPAGIPDSRNTVSWLPAVETDETGTADLSFTAPQIPGRYVILLQEMKPEGVAVTMTGLVIGTSGPGTQ